MAVSAMVIRPVVDVGGNIIVLLRSERQDKAMLLLQQSESLPTDSF